MLNKNCSVSRVENGLNVLCSEAKGCKRKDRTWKTHNVLLKRAEQHITACGGCWEDYRASLSREFADLLNL